MRSLEPDNIDISVTSDKIRRANKRDKKAGVSPNKNQACDWHGCTEAGSVRTAASPRTLTEYRYYCPAHAKEHHQKWDFFQGMSDQQRRDFFESGSVWDRPTQKVGSQKRTSASQKSSEWAKHTEQAFFDMFDGPTHRQEFQDQLKKKLPTHLKQCLAALNLDPPTTKSLARTQYKKLLKHYHPDLNGGDRSFEDRLNQIISAWRQIKETKLIPET